MLQPEWQGPSDLFLALSLTGRPPITPVFVQPLSLSYFFSFLFACPLLPFFFYILVGFLVVASGYDTLHVPNPLGLCGQTKYRTSFFLHLAFFTLCFCRRAQWTLTGQLASCFPSFVASKNNIFSPSRYIPDSSSRDPLSTCVVGNQLACPYGCQPG